MKQTLNSAYHRGCKIVGVQIDYEGAFENCSRGYLKDLLKLMGLGPKFLKWVDCLWEGMSGVISYGGIEQEPINLSGGLTQGAPESAVLFNLANIPLNLILLNLRESQYYPMEHELPFEMANGNRLNTYSDDSCTFVEGSPKSILEYIETVKSFTRITGQLVNEEKTKLLYSFTPEEAEIIELESKGLLRKNFYFPGGR